MPPANTPEYSVSTFHSEVFVFAADGARAGLAAELVNVMVDGIVEAFDDISILGMVAKSNLGRAALSVAIPYGLGLLTVVAPGAIPGGQAPFLREICLYAIQGHATVAMGPITARLKSTIRRVIDVAREGGIKDKIEG